MNIKKVLTLVSLLAATFVGNALAHPVEFIFEDNLDGTFTFSAMTIIHGSAANGTTGFLLNGNAVSFDNEYSISDPAWDALRAAAAGATVPSGYSFDQFSAQVVLDVTLNLATLNGYGFTNGGAFTINTYDSGLRWATNNAASMTFTASAVPDSGSTLALLGLSMLGFVGFYRRKN